MQKAKKIVLLVVLGLPVCCCLGGVILLSSASSNAKKSDSFELAEARRAGMPLEVADILQPIVPAKKNAAEIYRKAGDLLENRFDAEQKLVSTALAKNASEKDLHEGDSALAMMKPVMDLVGQLDSRPTCDFERDWNQGPALLFPEFADMKALTKDLCFRADRLDLNGDTGGSLRSMNYAFRVAHDAGTDPCLISMLVQVACHLIIDREYERLIDRHSHDRKYLTEVASTIQKHDRLPDPRKHLGGEIVLNRISVHMLSGTQDFDLYATDNGKNAKNSGGIQKSILRSGLVQSSLDAKLVSAWRMAWIRFPSDSQDWQAFEDAMKFMSAKVDQDQSLSNIFNRILMPVFAQAVDTVGNLQAHDRLLLTSIDLLKLRIDKGELPQTLPNNLGSVVLDPFDGNPLRYKLEVPGFMLYSIGRDRIDNGGRRRNTKDAAEKGFDEVVEFK
jgi:hypothetical protein